MVQSNKSNELNTSDAAVVFHHLSKGAKVRLVNGAIGEVTANPQDGGWIFLRFVESPDDPSKVGQEDMIFFTDVEALV